MKDIKLSSEQWEKVEQHISTHNEEMGIVKNDIAWLKEKLGTVDTRLWTLLGMTILGILVSIGIKVWFK